jgi:hypothetical protein
MYTSEVQRVTNGPAGRRIVELQTSQALLNSPQEAQPTIDQYGRKPFQHPALNGLQGLSDEAESKVLDKVQLSQIAERYDLDKVIRWKPKRVRISLPLDGHGMLTHAGGRPERLRYRIGPHDFIICHRRRSCTRAGRRSGQ